MIQIKKHIVLPIGFIVFLVLASFSSNAQTCDEGITNARSYYYNGDYSYVPSALQICINQFNSNEYRDYYLTEGRGTVFQVYKLICSAYYQTDNIYAEEDKENELIYYFNGIYSPGEVLDILDSTSI